MTIDEISDFIEGLDGVLVLRPAHGDGSPEIAWGDSFFYYAPDGVLPSGQPFATIVTKDYPDDHGSHLDRPGAFRVNLAAGTGEFVRYTGRQPREPSDGDIEPNIEDVIIAHPVYGSLGWLAIVNPGERSEELLRDLLVKAHHYAKHRSGRRARAAGVASPASP